MDIHRPHPVCGSAFHPAVVPQLENIAPKAESAAPIVHNAGVRLCLENHTEAFSDEVLWIINRVNHPYVEFDPGGDDREEARRREYEAVVDSIRFTRGELGVGQKS